MPEVTPFRMIITGPARLDIAAIVRWSLTNFGEAAALRYEDLILQALRDIEANPERPGSKERPEMIAGARTYHLSFSRSRVAGEKVKMPRHFVIYRYRFDGVIEVGRILHDNRDLLRNLPEGYRSNDA